MSQTEVQLIKDAVIVNADISNSAAIDVSKISGALPAAGGTITGDVTFDGETAGRDIVFDRSANALEFADSAKAVFGTGGDLEIFHDGGGSIIKDVGTGDLRIGGDGDLLIMDAALSETKAKFSSNGAVELYHNNTKELATTANGIDVFSDNAIVNIVSNASGTSTSFIQFRGYRIVGDVGRLGEMQFINQRDGDVQAEIEVIANGDTNSYFDFKTSNAGLRTLRVDHSGANFPDNIKARFGAGEDLQIFHDGTDSIIDNNTAALHIKSNTAISMLVNNSEDAIVANANGAVELYHDNTKRFETTSTGVQAARYSFDSDNYITCNTSANTMEFVTNSTDIGEFSPSGLMIRDNLQLRLGTGNDLRLYHDGTDNYISNRTGNLYIEAKAGETAIQIIPDNRVDLRFDGVKKFFTNSSGVTVESTGNTPKIDFRGASNLDMGKIDVDQFSTNYSMMRFYTMTNTSVTEYMRLLDNGNLCVGGMIGSSNNANIQSPGQGNGNTNVGSAVQKDGRFICNSAGSFSSFGRNDSGLVLSFTRQGGDQGGISVGVGSVTYGSGSDYRLKENVASLTDAITRIKQLLPKRFNFIEDTTNTLRDGFLAHEVSSIVPEAITGTKDEVDSDNKPVYQQIDQAKLVPLLVGAVQELITRVETLESA